MSELADLIAQRDGLADQLDVFKEFLVDYDSNPSIIQLQLRFSQITEAFADYNKLSDAIFKIDKSKDQINKRFKLQEDYVTTIDKAQKIWEKDRAKDNAVILPSNLLNDNSARSLASVGDFNNDLFSQDEVSQVGTGQSRNYQCAVTDPSVQDCTHPYKRSKRPDFPKFGGNPLQWITFKETFLSWQSQCHNNDIGRFHALKESLEKDALKKIENYHMTNKNYRGAWELLVKQYENPMTLVSHHLNALFDLPKVNSQNYKEIERVADAAESHVASLKTLDIDVGEEVVTCILERTLSPELLSDWRKEVGAASRYPKYSTMISFLYRTVSYLSQVHKLKKTQNDKKNSSKQNFVKKQTARALITAGKKCPLCPEKQHPLFKCELFDKKSVSERWKIVKEARVCFNCLTYHGKNDCKSQNRCKKCNRFHSTKLHYDKGPAKETENG